MPLPRVERRAALQQYPNQAAVVGSRRAVDGDAPRLHGFRDFPDQLDLQQAVVEGRTLYLDIVRQVELPLEMPGRNAPVKELALDLFGLAAFDRDDVLLGRDRDFVGRETRHRQRDLVAVLSQALDVIGRITFVGGPLGRLGEVEQAIETDGRSEQGREVVSAHSQILQRARWV
jgi:hypothetical protein